MTTHPLHLYSRSHVTKDWECHRSRYWAYEHDGTGVTRNHQGLELFLGTAIHDGIAAIIDGSLSIDVIASTLAEQVRAELLAREIDLVDTAARDFAAEQAALVEGLVRGFHLCVWPRLTAQYPTVVAVEQEMTFRHNFKGKADPQGAFLFMAKPDLVARDASGALHYLEWKSTSSKRDTWINSWASAIQLHSCVRAIEATLGEPVQSVTVQGLFKGTVSYEKQNSPMCYAYRRSGSPPFSRDEIAYEYKAGFQRSPVWERAGGVKEWVANMPPELLAEQFPCTPPIFVKDELVDAFFAQCALREHEIEQSLAIMADCDSSEEDNRAILNGSFRQNFSACLPAWGRACEFREICHGGCDDPLSEGWQRRVPHHEEERRQHEQET